jgi:hypothetical protein
MSGGRISIPVRQKAKQKAFFTIPIIGQICKESVKT